MALVRHSSARARRLRPTPCRTRRARGGIRAAGKRDLALTCKRRFRREVANLAWQRLGRGSDRGRLCSASRTAAAGGVAPLTPASASSAERRASPTASVSRGWVRQGLKGWRVIAIVMGGGDLVAQYSNFNEPSTNGPNQALELTEPARFHPAKQGLQRQDPRNSGNKVENCLEQDRPVADCRRTARRSAPPTRAISARMAKMPAGLRQRAGRGHRNISRPIRRSKAVERNVPRLGRNLSHRASGPASQRQSASAPCSRSLASTRS